MAFFTRLRSEYAYLSGAIRTLRRLKPVVEKKTRLWPDVLDELVEKFGDRPALLSHTQQFSYREFQSRVNQYARWAKAQNLQKGDVVGLLMPNCPEFLAVWTGIGRAGGVTALLNTKLPGAQLAHCINIVTPKHIIVDAALAEQFLAARQYLDDNSIPNQPTLWVYGDSPHTSTDTPDAPKSLKPLLEAADTAPLPLEERPDMTTDDKCLYIYTSGTTGLPKAANVNHFRVLAIMNGFSAASNASQHDRMYNCMPMFHSAGGLVATGSVLTRGGSVFIAERFSARTFWDDVVDNDCTMFQYIGELCRYLLNSPPHPKERSHKIRLCSGNGLRPDIWEAFQGRFQLPQILEWYAATESNAVFFNFDGKVGAVGRIPKWAKRRFVAEVVRYDHEAEAPKRNADGYCEICDPGEVGEVISKIMNDPKRPSQRFEGYSDSRESQKKVLESVFEPGDRWFRSGDLMRRDALGYFYFIDRIGDTFRWKGENIATSEVSESLTGFEGILEANVYGVSVPGRDGRAGMVALVAEDDFDPTGFYAHV
ncbi:MAG: long-chain-acyl-CoA synthetase [Hyphomicrobiales bacterium]